MGKQLSNDTVYIPADTLYNILLVKGKALYTLDDYQILNNFWKGERPQTYGQF